MASQQRPWLLDTRELVSEIWDNRIPELSAHVHVSHLLLCLPINYMILYWEEEALLRLGLLLSFVIQSSFYFMYFVIFS